MKDATKFANDIAQEGKRRRAGGGQGVGKTEIITLTPDQKAAMKKALVPCTRKTSRGSARTRSPRCTRKPASSRDRQRCVRAAARRTRGVACEQRVPTGARGGRRRMKFLDHLEEWLIAFLMGAATLLIFVAVVHRYAAGLPIPGVQDALLKIDLTWAQELCIYMFVWMAKFGAAYGVRTGIHVGVDVHDQPAAARHAQAYVLFGLAAGALFTGDRRHARRDVRLGHRAHRLGVAGPRAAEVDRYLCIPLGSYLMCFRFLQVAWAFARTGELPHHDVAHVEGIETPDINPYGMATTCTRPTSAAEAQMSTLVTPARGLRRAGRR
jgi:C4-dicarboxylate transporter DctQ subunit